MVEWSTKPKGDMLETFIENAKELQKIGDKLIVKIEYHPEMTPYLPRRTTPSTPSSFTAISSVPFSCPLVENILTPLWTLRIHRGNGDVEDFSGTPEEFIATMAKLSGV